MLVFKTLLNASRYSQNLFVREENGKNENKITEFFKIQWVLIRAAYNQAGTEVLVIPLRV